MNKTLSVNKSANTNKAVRMVLSNKGLIVDYDALKSYLGARAVQKLLKDLTLVKKKFAGRDRTVVIISKIYKIVKIPRGDSTVTLLTLPRFFDQWVTFSELSFSYELAIKNDEKYVTLAPSTFKTADGHDTIALKDYQQVIHDYLIETVYKPHLPNGNNNQQDKLNRGCVLVLDTGRGKTYTAGGLIRTLGVKTLVIAHNSRGADEWTKMLRNFPQLKIGYYLTNKKVDGDVVIMIINSAMRPNFDFPKPKTARRKNVKKTVDDDETELKKVISRDTYFNQFGFIIYDEVPEYLSEKRRALFWDTNFKYVLGLTATPDENLNDWDPIYKMHLGPLVLAEEIPGFSVDNVKWDFTVKVINYYGPPEFTEQKICEKTGSTVCAWMAEQFVTDPYRNQMIMDLIADFYNDGHYTYIFAEKRDILTAFAKRIREYLNLEAFIPENSDSQDPSQETGKVKNIMGGATDMDVSEAVEKSRIILTTYQYGGRGLSIGKMTRGIALTPRRHGMRQVCGRLTRADGDVTIPRIWVDICDKRTKQKDQLRTRVEDYTKKGYNIEYEDWNYEDITLTELTFAQVLEQEELELEQAEQVENE